MRISDGKAMRATYNRFQEEMKTAAEFASNLHVATDSTDFLQLGQSGWSCVS